MEEALGPPLRLNPRVDTDLYERRLETVTTQSATLAKLFLLGKPVVRDLAAAALEPIGLEALVDLGLAVLEGDRVRPTVRVTRHEGVLVASDVMAGTDPADLVTGPSPSARRVERLTIRRPVGRALDLGTGSGLQALLTARHSEQVVGVDVNERALAFASFNAALNGLSNVELRRGSWLEPVAGERFDLIVANPPYVVSPDTDFLYRDGDLAADAVTRQLMEEVPAYLDEGGFAHIMGNWAHRRDEDWRAPVEGWLAGCGCDVLLLSYANAEPVFYAAQWNLPVLAQGRDAYLSAVDRWLDYYRRHEMEVITEGMVVLRRRSGRNWVRAIEVPTAPTGAAGDQVLRLFEARDRREELVTDEQVRAAHLAAAPSLRWTRRSGRETLELDQGAGFAVPVPVGLAKRLATLDGRRALGEVVDSADAVEAARRLFALGLLVFPGDTR